MMRDLAQRVQRIKISPTLSISNRADELQAAGEPIINLSIGEPDFDTPEHIKKAAIEAIHQGHTKYTAIDGIQPLKQAVINKFKQDQQLDYDLQQILVSCGAKQSLYNLFMAVLNPQDEVIIQAPYWVSYPDMVKLADAEPVIIKTDLNQQFKMSAQRLEAQITSKTRLLILNSPSNPSGIMYKAEELKKITEVLLKYPNVLIVSDDIYEHHVWPKSKFINLLNVCPDLYERTILVNGVSKTYAMTGWRIGYAAGPAKIIAAMKKVQSQSTSNPNSIAQYAALAALTGDQTCVQKMTASYQQRHDFLVHELQKLPGIQCLPSDGTFYTFPNVEEAYKKLNLSNDVEFADYLLNKIKIATVPGTAFGTPGHIRLCYTVDYALLEEAMSRLNQLFK